MGIEIPDPLEVDPVGVGDDCTVCWGIDKPFGDDGTVSAIVTDFSGINKTDGWISDDGEPIEGAFQINQSITVPCLFGGIRGGFSISVGFFSGGTGVTVTNTSGDIIFLSGVTFACDKFIFNVGSFAFAGGTCQIHIPEIDS